MQALSQLSYTPQAQGADYTEGLLHCKETGGATAGRGRAYCGAMGKHLNGATATLFGSNQVPGQALEFSSHRRLAPMIKLYDLAGADEALRFSPHVWRVKMALKHKELEFETIPWRFIEKDAIAFSGQQARTGAGGRGSHGER